MNDFDFERSIHIHRVWKTSMNAYMYTGIFEKAFVSGKRGKPAEFTRLGETSAKRWGTTTVSKILRHNQRAVVDSEWNFNENVVYCFAAKGRRFDPLLYCVRFEFFHLNFIACHIKECHVIFSAIVVQIVIIFYCSSLFLEPLYIYGLRQSFADKMEDIVQTKNGQQQLSTGTWLNAKLRSP